MKFLLKYLSIGVLSSFISIYFYNYYDKSEITVNDLNYNNSIPVNYLYSNKNSISTDFTVAA